MHHLSSHSLRCGGASALFAAGASPLLIQQLGRWVSDAYLGHCFLSAAATEGLSTLMAMVASRRPGSRMAEEL